MANPVEICNLALSHLGSSATVSAIAPPDGSVEAGYCARFYGMARQIALTAVTWQFALKRVALAEVTNTSTVWLYAYRKPSDCLKPLRVLKSGAVDESYGADYEMEGQVIVTNEPEAVLKYAYDVTDTTQYTPEFVSVLSFMLASYLVGPIVKGVDGANAGAKFRERAMGEAALAGASDANRSHSSHGGQTPSAIAARA